MNQAKTPLHIAVLMGGLSAERDVSLRSGAACAAALRRLGHFVWEVDVRGPDFEMPQETDVAFLALHGAFGEDGQVQRILEARGMPFTGCDAESSRACMDKVISKQIMVDAGIPTPAYEILMAGGPRHLLLDFPVVIKPAAQGSSIGVRIVSRAEELNAAVDEALRYGSCVLVEEFVAGRELTVGILDDDTLPIVEIRPKAGFYDYRNKYTQGATEYLCPAPLDGATEERVRAWALRSFEGLGCRDFARVDVRLSEDGGPMILEINTLPGMTQTSLFPKAAMAAGISFDQLCGRMIELALRRRVPEHTGA